MRKTALIIFLISMCHPLFSQTIIKMKREGGVSIIPCKVNSLELELIFDTGASDVSISLTEANSMFKNGKLTNGDIIGMANYVDANGGITEGVVINIKEIEIAGLKMTNIKASVVKNLDAPLLLGQTAISKLGKIQLDLNSNTLTILKGKGNYDFSTYSLTDKIDKYYKEFSIVKIEKWDNKEGMFFTYTIPKKWKEQKVTNAVKFKNYIGNEYPYNCVIGLDIGIQTLPTLYNTYDSCQSFVESVNNLLNNVDPSFKLISTSQTKISFCKTIKNVILTKDQEINKLSFQYWIFCGNKCLSFIYTIYSSDIKEITSISDEFDNYCSSQVSNIVIYNALENAAKCSIESDASQNKKEISIKLNNVCNWLKLESGSFELKLMNNSTTSTLTISIGVKNNDLADFNTLNLADLNILKESIIKNIGVSQKVIASDIVSIKNRKFIYLKASSKTDNLFNLTETYYYVLSNRIITLFSFVFDEDKSNLDNRFQRTHINLLELLGEIEFIAKSTLTASDYYNKGVDRTQINDFEGAIAEFNIAIKLNPNYAEAFYNRGSAKLRVKDNKGAIYDFNKAIEINPNFEQSYYNRAIAKIQIKDYQGALTDYNKAIEIKTDFADAYLNRGLLKIAIEQKESGCADLRKSSSLGSVRANQAIKIYCK